jgi:hypothetical protein
LWFRRVARAGAGRQPRLRPREGAPAGTLRDKCFVMSWIRVRVIEPVADRGGKRPPRRRDPYRRDPAATHAAATWLVSSRGGRQTGRSLPPQPRLPAYERSATNPIARTLDAVVARRLKRSRLRGCPFGPNSTMPASATLLLRRRAPVSRKCWSSSAATLWFATVVAPAPPANGAVKPEHRAGASAFAGSDTLAQDACL